jgi:hypothetical protein
VTQPERFRFLPGRPLVAIAAAVTGAGLLVNSLLTDDSSGFATGTGGVILGAIVLVLALLYLFSPAWRIEVLVDDEAIEVQSRGDRRFRLPWTDVVRVVAAPKTATAFIDGGAPERSLLLPGPGKRAPYRIADQGRLFDLIRARVPADRITEVDRLRR